MTGPAIGKIKAGGKEVTRLWEREVEKEVDIYIHVRGYSLARVTHLDVEYGEFWRYIKRNDFAKVRGIPGGMLIIPKWKVPYCKIFFNYANEVLKVGEETWVFLGRKEEGFYLGFRKEYIERLEKVAKMLEPGLF